MSEITTVAILSPAPGKADRLKSLVQDLVKSIRDKEDYTLRYYVFEQAEAEAEPDLIFLETYKNMDGAKQHLEEPHAQNMFKLIESEGLLSKPPYAARTSCIAGFERDRQLI